MQKSKLQLKSKNYLCILGLLAFLFPGHALAAKLYLLPDSGSYYFDDSFTVDIMLDTEGEAINAVESGLRFFTEELEVVDINHGNSILNLWIQEPSYSNQYGLISFSGGVPTPGFSGKEGKVAAITLKSKGGGNESTLLFQENSRVLLNGGEGRKAVLELIASHYTFSEKPKGLLQLYSATHPNQNKWYNVSDVFLEWGEEQESVEFSYVLDQNKETQPDVISERTTLSISYSSLEDGIWYFHLRKFEKGRWSDTIHFKIQIDTQPPSSFQPNLSRSDLAFEGKYFIVFLSDDELSGIDYYEILEENQQRSLAKSPYVLKNQEPGEYRVTIRAIDLAGNIQEEELAVSIPKKKASFLRALQALVVAVILLLSLVFYKMRTTIYMRVKQLLR